ncbi:MAG: RIP metalloprotease RseP [Alphaproteobacteria bacterium]|nr:RIP metalloprotease RseP [Alphaproteobacteria bacterium]
MDILNFVWTNGVSFIVIISVIVFVHELGHYLIARLNGVLVEVFSIGFGPGLTGWTDSRGTRWKLSLLPLGGYVKMLGEHSGPEGASPPSDSYAAKRVGQRAAVAVAGPVANFIFAILVLAILFVTFGQRVTPPEVTTVNPGSAAEAAGILGGDIIVAMDGETITRFEDIQHIVRFNPDRPLDVVVSRGGAEVALQVTPRLVEREDRFGNVHRIGELGIVRSGSVVLLQLDPLSAVGAAFSETWSITWTTLDAVGQMIVGTRGTEDLGGPLRIAQLSGQVAEDGFVTMVWFMAMLSINLGLINLFPIPMLDGGHLAFYAVEALRGRPLGAKAQEVGLRIGLALVVGLMILATWNDIVQMFVKG